VFLEQVTHISTITKVHNPNTMCCW